MLNHRGPCITPYAVFKYRSNNTCRVIYDVGEIYDWRASLSFCRMICLFFFEKNADVNKHRRIRFLEQLQRCVNTFIRVYNVLCYIYI